MKKWNKALLKMTAGILITGALSGGCAQAKTSTFPPQQNAVYVSREGALYTSLVKNYDSSDTGYDAEELKAMAEAELADYNREYGSGEQSGPVSVADCKIEGGTASIVYQYTSADDLCRFTLESQDTDNHPDDLQVTTNSAYLTGGAGPDAWTDARKNQGTDLNTVLKKSDLPMVVVTGSVVVQTEGQILYYGGAVSLKDEYTAQVTEGTAWIVFR